MPKTASTRRRSKRATRCEKAKASTTSGRPARATTSSAVPAASIGTSTQNVMAPRTALRAIYAVASKASAENVARSFMRCERYGGCGAPTRPATPHLPSVASPRSGSVRDEAFTRELVTGLLERQVGGRDDHVGLLQHVVADGLAVGADELDEGGEGGVEGLLVSGLDGADDLVVELVEPVGVRVREVVLPLRGDPDDHAGRSWEGAGAGVDAGSPEPSAAWGAVPWPSSARSRLRSSSTAEAEDSSCSWRSMSSWPAVRLSWSSNAPEASSSSMALARARMFSVLSTARCIAIPTSAISSPTPDAASEIRTEASAAEYCALMTSFLVRN